MTHICVGKLTIIGSDNGLSPRRRQAIIWTNAGILLNGPRGLNFNDILIEIHTFWFKKIHFKMSSGKRRPCCFGLNVLTQSASDAKSVTLPWNHNITGFVIYFRCALDISFQLWFSKMAYIIHLMIFILTGEFCLRIFHSCRRISGYQKANTTWWSYCYAHITETQNTYIAVNTSTPKINGCQFADDIFMCM